MKKIHIEFSDERLITPSGLVFVGQILGKSSFVKKINRAPISKDYLQKQIKNGDVLLTYIGITQLIHCFPIHSFPPSCIWNKCL